MSTSASASWSLRPLVSLCVVQIILLCGICAQEENRYYVKPSAHSECPDKDRPCKTLDEYANSTQDLGDHVVLLFLEGVHELTTRDLHMTGSTDFRMAPASSTADRSMVRIELSCCGMTFNMITSPTIENLTISSTQNNSPKVVLDGTAQATVQNLHVIGTSILVTVNGHDSTTVIIRDSLIEQSSNTGVYVEAKTQSSLKIDVVNTTISHHKQGGIIVGSSSTSLTVNIDDTVIEHNSIASMVANSSIDAAGLAVYSTRSKSATVNVQNSHFINNNDLRGNPVVVYVSRLVSMDITDSEFRDNRGTALRAVNIGGGVYLHGNITFHHNVGRQGGALALISTPIYLMRKSNVSFLSNSADDVGGAIFVESSSIMYEENDPHTDAKCFYQFPEWQSSLANDDYTSVMFKNNYARNGGHHIYGSSLKSYCVVYPVAGFFDNIIRSIDPDVLRLFHFDDQVVSPISSNPSRVCIVEQAASNQSFSEDCTNTSQIFRSLAAIPGEEFYLEAVLVGGEFGTGTGAVYAQFLPSSAGSSEANLESSYQYSQRVNSTSASRLLRYSVLSNNTYEILVLSATDGAILTDGVEKQIEDAVEVYEEYEVAPAILLTTPVYIHINLLQCPLGFYKDTKSMGCICNPKLCTGPEVTGHLTNRRGFINVSNNIWVDAYNDSESNVSGILIHNNCPFDYCSNANHSPLISLENPNAQCAVNRGGILCGACENGSSLAIGSSECLQCEDSNGLLLLIFFAAAGFLIVIFIKLLNLTVSQGTINGLVFYANIIWAYQDIFLSDVVGKTQFLYTFIAWLNLDFGIEICFFQGLTAFGKTWLQFLFPLYIWSIAGGMILLAHYSERMTKLFGKNSVHVLATLFLLSYAKILRIVIDVLFPATLYVYTDQRDPVKSLTKVVWALDGNLDYGRYPHIFLLVVILLIVIPFLWLPYSLILLFVQPLRRYSHHSPLKWVNRFTPFIEAYVGPLSAPNQHWVGLLLLARFTLLLVFTSTYANNPNTSLLALVIVMVILFSGLSYVGEVLYKPDQPIANRFLPEKVLKYRSILEISFLFNLAVVGVSVLYVSQDDDISEVATHIIVIVSVAIALLQFIGIVLLHFVCAVKRLICKTSDNESVGTSTEYHSLEEERDTATPPTTSTIVMGSKASESCGLRSRDDDYIKSYESAQFREPMLTESTA